MLYSSAGGAIYSEPSGVPLCVEQKQGSRLLSEAASQRSSISLANLIALNDEIAALVPRSRAARPRFDRVGSRAARQTWPRDDRSGARLARGESLPHAISANQGEFPPVYRAVVEAGLASGRLPVVLEALASGARRLADLRRVAITALVYPLCVVLIAIELFAFYLLKIVPQLLRSFGDSVPAPLRWLQSIAPYVELWGFVLPAVIVLLFAAWWYRSSRAAVFQGRGGRWWWPSLGRLVSDTHVAAMSEILALLLEHGVPLPTAIELASRSVGNPTIEAAGGKTAAALRQGIRPKIDSAELAPFPPLMRWLLATGEREQTLVPLLRHAAENYRKRAMQQADWIRLYLPVILLVLIGGVTTFIYALTLFLPWAQLLEYLRNQGVKTPGNCSVIFQIPCRDFFIEPPMPPAPTAKGAWKLQTWWPQKQN